MLRYHRVMILILLLSLVFIPAVEAGESFSDLPPDHWVYESLASLVDAGLIEEYQNGEALLGKLQLSRYEAALIVGRVHERLDQQQRLTIERALLQGPTGAAHGLDQALAVMDRSLWEQIFNYALTSQRQAFGGVQTSTQVASARQSAARAADALTELTVELRQEMELLGLFPASVHHMLPASPQAETSGGESIEISASSWPWSLEPDSPQPETVDRAVFGSLGASRIGVSGDTLGPRLGAALISPGLEVWVIEVAKPVWQMQG